MRKICVYLSLILLVCLSASAQTRSTNVKALVGGTLIDGYGSTPIRNSVVISRLIRGSCDAGPFKSSGLIPS